MTAANLPSAEDVVAAGRLCDLLAAAELAELDLPPIRLDRTLPARLRIVYLVTRATAHEKEPPLLVQAARLAALGADVTVLVRAEPDEVGDPTEHRIAARLRQRQVPYGESMTEAIGACDLVVAGSWEFVLPARMLGIAPVVLFEQGGLRVLGEVPDHIHAVVAASLRAASITFVADEQVGSLLQRSYGVDALVAPGVIDLDCSRRRRSRPRAVLGGRRGVLVWPGAIDGPESRAAREVIVAGLAVSHPDECVSPAASGSGDRSRLGEASAQRLAVQMRSVRVLLATAGAASFDIAPLAAMACGTPVVAVAHEGTHHYAEDGVNALVVPSGDHDALLRAARRVLDDAPLAEKLVAGGHVTAQAFGWAAVGPQLLARYEDVVNGSGTVPPLGGFSVHLGGLRFVRSGDAARLRARLGACTTQEVALPVSQPAIGEIRAVRWRVVARRNDGVPGTTRVYLPARSDRPLDDSAEQASLDLLRAGKAEAALAGFVEACEHETRSGQAVLGRWIVLSMLAANRPRDGAEVATAFARDFPVHPDYVALWVLCATRSRRPVDATAALARVRLVGVGARYDEWFEDPSVLLSRVLE